MNVPLAKVYFFPSWSKFTPPLCWDSVFSVLSAKGFRTRTGFTRFPLSTLASFRRYRYDSPLERRRNLDAVFLGEGRDYAEAVVRVAVLRTTVPLPT